MQELAGYGPPAAGENYQLSTPLFVPGGIKAAEIVADLTKFALCSSLRRYFSIQARPAADRQM